VTSSAQTHLAWRRSLIGISPEILQVCEIIGLIASKRCTVLITGESGTGKEVIARAIHAASQRSQLPMVAVNCAALPNNLIETELFGHAKGAFTGAHASRVGRFEQAHRGTIFLDEIGDLPLDAQAKLLRVLQQQEFERVGSSETVSVDVRVIAASNVDLAEAIRQRRFREDLYYRLNVVPIHLPPLRERRDDIPLLIEHFMEKISADEHQPPKQVSEEAFEFLRQADWPGNIRQLEHALRMAIALSGDRQILRSEDFRFRRGPQSQMRCCESRPLLTVPRDGLDFDEVVSEFELSLLRQALAVAGGNKARAASLLNIKRTTLLAKMKTLEDRSPELVPTQGREAWHKPSLKASRLALVCEKVDPVRDLISRTVRQAGYRILEVSTPAAALELFECWSSEISLVVTSRESGKERHTLLSRIRHRSPHVSAIILGDWDTAGPDAGDLRTRVVARPFSCEDLLLALQKLDREHRAVAHVVCA